MANIEDELNALAEQAGLSQNALAARAGIPLSTFRRRLKRPEDFTLGEVLSLAEALGVTPDALLATTSAVVA